jgi:hypothetical protein
MERFDLDLLLSVAGGLGRWQEYGNRRMYVKDDDCLGESQLLGYVGQKDLRIHAHTPVHPITRAIDKQAVLLLLLPKQEY